MVKKVRSAYGVLRSAALVVTGWGCFIWGQVTSDILLKCVLLSIARVLPYEFSALLSKRVAVVRGQSWAAFVLNTAIGIGRSSRCLGLHVH